MTLLIIFFLLSIVFSFLCSVWEAVLLSITPAFASRKLQDGSAVGKLIKEYKDDIDKPLSAILTLNTIAHTVGAIGVGAQAGKIFGSNYFDIGITSISYESVIAGLMTLAILILSEIIPKTIGANMWQSLAGFTMRSIKFIMVALYPFVWLSQIITKKLKKDKSKSVLSKADIAALAIAGMESGALQKDESEIIQNLMRLNKLFVKDIMTPKTVMKLANQDLTVEEFYTNSKPLPYSRIPIYDNTKDHITGVVLKTEVLQELAEDRHETKLHEIKRDLIYVQDDLPLAKLLDRLVSGSSQLAIVTDEFGTVIGLVTYEDLFETLLGFEITDETDTIEDLQKHARSRWEERAKKNNKGSN